MSNSFWKVIEQAKEESGKNLDGRPVKLKSILLTLGADAIVRFNNSYHSKLAEAYRWDLWGAAYLINGGCSDDGFDYWCDFLISEGKNAYDSALRDPDSLSSLDDIQDVELEEYRYAISEAYEELTGVELPETKSIFPAEPKGEEWDEDKLAAMFPKLAAKYM